MTPGKAPTSRVVEKQVKLMLYRTSITEQFEKHAAARKEHEKKAQAHERKQLKALGAGSQQTEYENILSREWLAHLRSTLQPGELLEMPTNGVVVYNVVTHVASPGPFMKIDTLHLV